MHNKYVDSNMLERFEFKFSSRSSRLLNSTAPMSSYTSSCCFLVYISIIITTSRCLLNILLLWWRVRLLFVWWTQSQTTTDKPNCLLITFHMCYLSRTSRRRVERVDWLIMTQLCSIFSLVFTRLARRIVFFFMVLLRLLELLTAGGRSQGRLRSTDHFRP
jgi:hypothetical protein